MNGRALVITVISVSVALGGLMLQGFSRIDTEIAGMRDEIGDLRERMARLEGRMDTMVTLFEGHITEGDCN